MAYSVNVSQLVHSHIHRRTTSPPTALELDLWATNAKMNLIAWFYEHIVGLSAPCRDAPVTGFG